MNDELWQLAQDNSSFEKGIVIGLLISIPLDAAIYWIASLVYSVI